MKISGDKIVEEVPEETEIEEEMTEEEVVEKVIEEKEEKVLVDEEPIKTIETITEENKTEIKSSKSNKRTVLLSVIAVIAIFIALILSTGFALVNINNSSIIAGIVIKDIDVQGLNKEQAMKLIKGSLDFLLEKEVNIKIDDFEYSISPDQIEAEYNIVKAVEEAYLVGRQGNIFTNNFEIVKTWVAGKSLDVELTYNEKLLDDVISDIMVTMPGTVVEPSYYIEEEGEMLIIVKGEPGVTIDKVQTKELVLAKIKNNDGKSIVLKTLPSNPKEIDIDKIYAEIYCEPKDAYYIEEPFQVFPHVSGLDFDLGAAKEMLKEDKSEYEIPLKITLPTITTNKIGTKAFPNLLGRYTTRYDARVLGRSNNLELAARKIDGVVVMPGEIFSYNRTVGKRTVEAGFQEGLGYTAGKAIPMIGGGICQTSSTLYDAVVYANLEIVERYNHMFNTTYAGAGRDATVSWGTADFRFKNTRKYPVMIKAAARNRSNNC